MNTLLTEKDAFNEDFLILNRLFDNILAIDFKDGTMRCVKWNEDTEYRMPENIRMILKDALDFLFNSIISDENNDRLREFLEKACTETDSAGTLRFHIRKADGNTSLCVGEIICTSRCCWMCFNNTEKLKKRFNITTESYFEKKQNSRVVIQTFGFFDVFVDGKAVLFRSKKAKELLALLVDRKGGYISSSDAIACLWEDSVVDEKILSRYRKIAMRLNNTLKEYGIEDIIENIDGQRRIIPEKVSCDLYDYLSDKARNSALFNGNYMLDYSWGEITLAGL